ncbi:hypothetical protein [Kineosporia succinea]|uniref:Uncharacterized protein n=1 Tax=Kineosporia succinea TaxID=84632 RepID=A0ABT9P7K0_9ACTN|nr:hypothetical protein [Kineosporia succinea]MDP9828135.1 hypothetical protein [Kineosporia succinea]
MPSVPRIRRATPHGAVHRLEKGEGLPVVAVIRWHHGINRTVPATATAWTRDAVEISWEPAIGEGLRTDWVAATDVTREIDLPDLADDTALPPHTISGQSKRRW